MSKGFSRRVRAAVLAAVLLAGVLLVPGCGPAGPEAQLARDGWRALDHAMQLAGYTSNGDAYTKDGITVALDTEAGVAQKNEYTFALDDQTQWVEDTLYITEDKLAEIINLRVTGKDEVQPVAVNWTDSRLVVHACGGVMLDGEWQDPANHHEGMVASYNAGYRVFEVDLTLTSDGKLVAKHEWTAQGGVPMTHAEWKAYKIRGQLTTMDIDDVIQAMYVNKDMVVVTDTKSHAESEAYRRTQFEEIVRAANAVDPSILQRIVPQIYQPEMLELVQGVYDFPNIIFTLYMFTGGRESVLDFVAQHEVISVVTMPSKKANTEYVAELGALGKLVYTHSPNTPEEILADAATGAHGFYSSKITPAMLEELLAEGSGQQAAEAA